MVELCPSRITMLSMDEETLLRESKNLTFEKIISLIKQVMSFVVAWFHIHFCIYLDCCSLNESQVYRAELFKVFYMYCFYRCLHMWLESWGWLLEVNFEQHTSKSLVIWITISFVYNALWFQRCDESSAVQSGTGRQTYSNYFAKGSWFTEHFSENSFFLWPTYLP